MSNDEKSDPLDDVKKGLGLLFRAAKTAAKNLPTQPIEKVVLDSAREVGRAVENVASSIEKEMFGDRSDRKKNDTSKTNDAPPPADAAPTEASAARTPASPPAVSPQAKTPEEPPKGPRVG